ncbi:MAG: hypothetical protein AAF417_12600 [Pseudomonadota bacterium]
MLSKRSRGFSLIASMSIAPNALGDEYTFDLGLAFDGTSFDGSQSITTLGGNVFSSNAFDTDEVRAFGRWYFSGLSDAIGPRARAAFVDRASSLSLSYSHLDQRNTLFRRNDDPSLPISPLDTVVESDGDSFAAEIRYVDRDSGWFGDVDLLATNFLADGPNGTINGELDTRGWSIGFGKYLLEATALGLEYGELDSEGGGDTSAVAATLTHLGTIGERWQYAIDLEFSRLNPDVGADQNVWGSAIALYPTPNVEFGIGVEDVSTGGRQFIDLDRTTIEGFASWFLRENVQISAHYRVDDVDFAPDVLIGGAPTEAQADRESFGISATVRF